jgi:hypothetical protein
MDTSHRKADISEMLPLLFSWVTRDSQSICRFANARLAQLISCSSLELLLIPEEWSVTLISLIRTTVLYLLSPLCASKPDFPLVDDA